MSLEHSEPDCTGSWHAWSVDQEFYLRCEVCHVKHFHSPEVAKVALRENSLGISLRLLTNAGQMILEQERH